MELEARVNPTRKYLQVSRTWPGGGATAVLVKYTQELLA